MKTFLKTTATLAVLIISLGFAKDEVIELEHYLNGRSSANFLKETNNVKFTLPPGTQGKIQESKKFSSGNYGLKVEVTSGAHKGESVWVYYRSADPGMKLYANEEAARKGQETKDVEKAQAAHTTREHSVIRDPASTGKEKPAGKVKSEKLDKEDAAETVRRVTEANAAVQKHGKPGGPCAECDVAKVYSRDANPEEEKRTPFVPRSSQEPGVINPPQRTSNPYGVRSTSCRTLTGGVDYCTYEGDSEPGAFKISNRGPNSVVSAGNEARYREWGFYYEGKARQDLGISISDSPNGTISEIQETYMMVFPRKTLPSVRTVGDKQIVTLPTGETVTFDRKTKQVIGGVLSEDGPMTKGGKTPMPAKVSYHGNGVMVRVDTHGDEPRLAAPTAVITKQGKTCKVPAKKLWPDRSKNSAAHFKYFSDSDFDEFLKANCGFGL